MNEDEIKQERREECRWAVLDFLAFRLTTAHHPQTIRRRLADGHEHDFTVDEVRDALAFLSAKGWALELHEQVGATRYYQATSAGVLASERHRAEG